MASVDAEGTPVVAGVAPVVAGHTPVVAGNAPAVAGTERGSNGGEDSEDGRKQLDDNGGKGGQDTDDGRGAEALAAWCKAAREGRTLLYVDGARLGSRPVGLATNGVDNP